MKNQFKISLTKKIIFFYFILVILSVAFTSIFSYIIFQRLMDNQINNIDLNTSAIKMKLEKLYEKKTNLIELPDLNEKLKNDTKEESKMLLQTIEQNFPGYTLKMPTVEGTLEYKESPKLLYDNREKKYFLEITREIKFEQNLPFKSLQLSIKLNYYQIILRSLIMGTLLATLFLIPFIILFSRTIITPIIKVSKASNQIATGDLNVHIDFKSNDEIGELANSFNFMSNELSKIKKIRDDLLATISHELRSPLGRIKGYNELLFDLELDKNEQDKYFKSILQEIDFLDNMIAEIIEISRLELQKEKFFKEKMDLAFLLEIINEDLELEKSILKIDYEFKYQENLYCYIDVDKIRRVFLNVFQNSVKAKATKIIMEATKIDDEIEIKIIDDGVGIPEDQLEVVFEKFYRVDKSRDRKTGGFGLGLAICKGIIKEHNGKIFFVKKDKGAELHILLPALDIKDNV